MARKIKEIDNYISKAEGFAKPILLHLRELVHKACPDVEEKIKWSFPHFDYKGEMMCSMASFKQHCAFGFWKAALMKDKELLEMARTEEAMGHLGKITSLKDLPSDKKLTAYIKEAMKLTDEGKKLPSKPKAMEKSLQVPDYILKAIAKNKAAWKVYEQGSYSFKKEYVEWVTEAKTESTRESRLETAVEWMAEGKSRHWKYKK